MDKVNILEVDFSNITLDEAADKMLSFLKDGKKHMIFTPNSEILYDAYKDSEFKKILNSADMNVPDGIGVVYASAINGKKLKQRVAGYDSHSFPTRRSSDLKTQKKKLKKNIK